MEVDWEGTSASSRGPRAGVRDWKLWVDKIEDTTARNDRDHVHCPMDIALLQQLPLWWALLLSELFFLLGFGCRLRVGAPTSCCERWLGWSPKSCEAQSWRPAGIFVGDFSRSFWGGPMDKTGSHKDSTTVVVLCGSVGHLHSIVTNSQVERVAAME